MKKIFSIYDYDVECPELDLIDIVRLMDAYPASFDKSTEAGNLFLQNTHIRSYRDIYSQFEKEIQSSSIEKIIDLIVETMDIFKVPWEFYDPNFSNDKDIQNILNDLKLNAFVKKYLYLIAMYEMCFATKKSLKILLQDLECESSSIQSLIKLYKTQYAACTKDVDSSRDEVQKKLQGTKYANMVSFSNSKDTLHTAKAYGNKDYIGNLITDTHEKNAKKFTLFDFIILKGLFTLPRRDNPFIEILERPRTLDKITEITNLAKEFEVFHPDHLKKLLAHFTLHQIPSFTQKPLFVALDQYLIERITNINLINRLYNLNMTLYALDKSENNSLPLLDYCFGFSVYPLVDFRLQVIDYIHSLIGCKSDHNRRIVKNLIDTMYHQAFIYFPMLYFFLRLCLKTSNNFLSNDVAKSQICIRLFDEKQEKHKRKGAFRFDPVQAFPEKCDEKIYQFIARYVQETYYESLLIPQDDNVFNSYRSMFYLYGRTFGKSDYKPIFVNYITQTSNLLSLINRSHNDFFYNVY